MTTKRTFSNHKARCIHFCWFPPGSWNHMSNFNFGQCVDLGWDWWTQQEPKVGNETLPGNVGGDTELGGGEGRVTAPQIPKNSLKGGEVKEGCVGPGVFGTGTHLSGSLLGQTGRVRPADADCVQAERGERWDLPFQLHTPDLGLLTSWKISVSQPDWFPGRAWQRCLAGSQFRAALVKTLLPLLGQSHPKFVFSADFPFVLPSRPRVCSTWPGMWVPYTMQCVQWCMLCSPSAFSGFQRKLQKLEKKKNKKKSGVIFVTRIMQTACP